MKLSSRFVLGAVLHGLSPLTRSICEFPRLKLLVYLDAGCDSIPWIAAVVLVIAAPGVVDIHTTYHATQY
jgi:hypothetical protein